MLEQANAYWEKKDYQKALPWYEQALPLAEKEWGSDSPQFIRLLLALGIGHHLQGDHAGAVPFFQRSLDIITNSPAMKDRDRASMAALNGLGLCYLAQEDHRRAAPAYEGALAIEERLFPSDHANLYVTLSQIARSHHGLKEYNRALHFYERALSLAEKTLPGESPEMAKLLCTIGTVHIQNGDNDKALPFLERGLSIFDNQPGGTNEVQDLPLFLLLLAEAQQSHEEFAPAIKTFERLLAIKLATHDPATNASMKALADLYSTTGNFAKALSLYSQLLVAKESAPGSEHREEAAVLNNMAEVYRDQGDYRNALSMYQRALAINEKVLGLDHPGVATVLNNLAILHMKMADYSSAVQFCERGLAIRQKAFGRQHRDVATSLGTLAQTYKEQGRIDEALKLDQECLQILEGVLGKEHSEVATILGNLATLSANGVDGVR